MEKSLAVLAERAQSMVRDLGYSDTPADAWQDFSADLNFLRYIAVREPARSRWNHEIGPVNYYFRGSPQPLYTYDFFNSISEEAPPLTDAGATMVRLSPKGRLLKLIIVPPQVEKAGKSDAPPAVDWSVLFREAGFDAAHWAAAAPEWTPPTYADTRAAWTGAVEEFPGTPMRIEAASYRGKAVYFELIAPWTRAARMKPYEQTTGEKVVQGFFILMLLLLLVGSALLARRMAAGELHVRGLDVRDARRPLSCQRFLRARTHRRAAFLVSVHSRVSVDVVRSAGAVGTAALAQDAGFLVEAADRRVS
jgi:hypothetical protein